MALTNTLVNNVCYPSVSDAADAFYSQIPVSLLVGATDSYRLLHVKTGSVWYIHKLLISSSGSRSVLFNEAVTPPTFPQCDATAAYFDGMQIGWGVVTAMIAVYTVIMIRKALFVS